VISTCFRAFPGTTESNPITLDTEAAGVAFFVSLGIPTGLIFFTLFVRLGIKGASKVAGASESVEAVAAIAAIAAVAAIGFVLSFFLT
jgi:hypothetical protein